MWSLTPFLAVLAPSFSNLPSWLSVPLSLLLVMSFLSAVIAAATQLSVNNSRKTLIEKMRMKNLSEQLSDTTECLNTSKLSGSSLGIDIPKAVALILISTISLSILGYAAIQRRAVYEYTEKKDGCCKIIAQLDPYTFIMEKWDGQFKAPLCSDYNVPGLHIQPGYMIWKLRYKDMGECWSIERSDLGIWFKRDPITHLAERYN